MLAAMSHLPTRRDVLRMLGLLGLAPLASLAGCEPETGAAEPNHADPTVTEHTPGAPKPLYPDGVQAAMDVLLPAERDAAGAILVPGAVEAGAPDVLQIADLVPLVQAQGLLPPGIGAILAGSGALDIGLHQVVAATLDGLAFAQRPLTAFRDLPRDLQEAAIEAGFDDPAAGPVLQALRAACFLAWLGAVTSDVGLRAIGYPPFEDFAAGVAVSGYPRRLTGEQIDPQDPDFATLQAGGLLDDYTYNLTPVPTPGDDLSGVLNEHGDLL